MFQNTDFSSVMKNFDWHKHRIHQHLKKRRLITAKQQHSVSEEKFEVFLSHLFKVVKPLLTFLRVVQPCVWFVVLALVLYGMVTAGRMNCWQTHAVLVLAAVRVSWNSTTWCEASFPSVMCEFLNEVNGNEKIRHFV